MTMSDQSRDVRPPWEAELEAEALAELRAQQSERTRELAALVGIEPPPSATTQPETQRKVEHSAVVAEFDRLLEERIAERDRLVRGPRWGASPSTVAVGLLAAAGRRDLTWTIVLMLVLVLLLWFGGSLLARQLASLGDSFGPDTQETVSPAVE